MRTAGTVPLANHNCRKGLNFLRQSRFCALSLLRYILTTCEQYSVSNVVELHHNDLIFHQFDDFWRIRRPSDGVIDQGRGSPCGPSVALGIGCFGYLADGREDLEQMIRAKLLS